MPYVQFSPDGEIEALFLSAAPDRPFLPLSDMRVLRFLQASDPQLTTALLNSSDNAHRVLLSGLIDLLVRKQILQSDPLRSERELPAAHRRLSDLVDAVEMSDEEVQQTLTDSDRNTARITEDIIDLLVAHRAISLDDLPPGARHLLEVRRALRDYLADVSGDDI